MFAEERQQKIYDLVCNKKSVKVSELSEILGISEVTVRRDLEELNRQNRIIRTHGGAIAVYSVANEISVMDLMTESTEEKRKIAERAYKYIQDNDTIFADGSSTVYELIKLIASGKKKNLIIITTSPLVIGALSSCQNYKVIAVGGEINYHNNCYEGYIAKMNIKSLRADKCFIGINGIDKQFGYSTPRFEDAEIKKLLIECSNRSYLLADHTKFGKAYLTQVIAECDYLITDTRDSEVDYEWLNGKTNVVFADKDK